jgi:hypothetical protein
MHAPGYAARQRCVTVVKGVHETPSHAEAPSTNGHRDECAPLATLNDGLSRRIRTTVGDRPLKGQAEYAPMWPGPAPR